MTALALRGLAARKLRSALTAIAVLLGVAMIAGTYVLTDQIRGGFEDLQENVYAGVDAEVTARESFDSQFALPKPLDAALVDRVRAVDGVAAAEGQLEERAALVVDGKLKESGGEGGLVVSTATPEPFDSTTDVDGRIPNAPGEVALLRDTADRHGIDVGDSIGVAARSGVQPVEVVGVFELGNVSSLGSDLLLATLADQQRWFDREGEVTSIVAAAEDGVTPEQIAPRIRAELPDSGLQVKTGSESARETADEINDEIGGFLTPALLAFAGAALLVGAFIIFNTFSITVAERTREFALLRMLGSTRRQILQAVAAEALVIGVVASVIGLLLGLVFARLLNALFEAVGFGLPTAGVELATRTIVVSLLVGIVVTLISALAPALRATRVPPIAALRTSAGAAATTRRKRFAPFVAAGVVALGLALLLIGLFGSGPADSRLGAMGGGVIFLFIGVALSARWFVRPLASFVGWPVQRLFREPGLLARENAMRNPARTATTAAALMVGLGLVVFVAVFAQGLKASFTDSIDRLIASDIIITERNFNPLPGGLERAVAGTEGVGVAAPLRFDDIRVGGKSGGGISDVVNGVDPQQIARVYDADWLGDADDSVWSELSPGTAVVEEQFAKSHKLEAGETFRVRGTTGETAELRALAVYRDPLLMSGIAVDNEVYSRLSTQRDPVIVLADIAQGADRDRVEEAVEQAARSYPTARVESNAEYLDTFEEQLGQLVGLLYALLGMSLVISLFGIANSLFLTIHERTRELGLLRAIGSTRSQVNGMVTGESVITAVIGGLLGTAVGVFFAFLVTQALDDLGLGFSLPAGQLALFLALSVVVGIVGAVAPARRAARLSVLDALRTD